MNRIQIMVKSLHGGAAAHTVLTELDDQKLLSRGRASIKRTASYMSQTFFFFYIFFYIDNKKSIQGLILHKIGMIAVNMRYITAIDP